jgi:hypothetical protein
MNGTKRARIDNKQQQQPSLGRPQLLLATEELRKRTGKKYCDESELLPLLLAQGLVRRVRTNAVEVRPLSGDSFYIRVDASRPTVGEAKEQIERDEGTKPERQLLCRVQVSSDGSNVREFDQEPEELKDDAMALEEGDVIAMGVMSEPDGMQWRTYPADRVAVSEDGNLVTQTADNKDSLTHTGEELTEGKHYWEVEVVARRGYAAIGVCRPDANPRAFHGWREQTTVWLMSAGSGCLFGNGKCGDNKAGDFSHGDRVGVLLDLDDGSLRFFKNGVQHGPGYPAGSVAGPVALVVQMNSVRDKARLLPGAKWPTGHSP